MTRWIVGVAAVVVAVVIAACSDDDSSAAACPDETTVGSGAACSTAAQKCTGSVDIGACPGQATMIAEYECTCTSGKWNCPQPAAPMCPADAAADVDAATNDGAAVVDASPDVAETSTGDDAAPDAPSEAATGDDAGDAASE